MSDQFYLYTYFKRFKDLEKDRDSCVLSLMIKDRKTKVTLDTLSVMSLFYDVSVFANCDNARSFSPKYYKAMEVVNNSFGDIIVADLNFDGLDDIAVIRDSGGSSGPLYQYFIQTQNQRFISEPFLTDSIAYFPGKIDPGKHQLLTTAPAGACCAVERLYQYHLPTRQWKQISRKLLGAE